MLRNQGTLHDHWILFRRMLKSVHHDPVAVGVQPEKMRALEKLVGDYENSLLSGKIFQVRLIFCVFCAYLLLIVSCQMDQTFVFLACRSSCSSLPV